MTKKRLEGKEKAMLLHQIRYKSIMNEAYLETKSSFSTSKAVKAWRFPIFEVTIPAYGIC